MEELYKRTGVKRWHLNPVLVEAAGSRADWTSSFGQNVVAPVLGLLSLRRALRSRLMLPDGTPCYPGADLLPMTIVIEELNFDRKRQNYIQDHGRTCATNSFIPGHGENFTASRGNMSSSQQEGSINFSAYREGMLITYDWRNSKILYSNVEEIFGADANTIETAINAFRDGNIPPNSQLQRHSGPKEKGKGPTVGVDHVQTLLSDDQSAGLDYFFTRTCLDPDVNAPTGRSGWLNWLCAARPILARCLKLAHKYVLQHKERL
ncbi:hypothetical protein Trisim1_009381 [Trichoderma cf. simile WF8]